jgi:uncharacterized protein (DUF3084 family)
MALNLIIISIITNQDTRAKNTPSESTITASVSHTATDTPISASETSDASMDPPNRRPRVCMNKGEALKISLAAQEAPIDDRNPQVTTSQTELAEQNLELQQQQKFVQSGDLDITTRLGVIEEREAALEIHSKELQNREGAARILEGKILEKCKLIEARECAALSKEEANEKHLASIQMRENDFVAVLNCMKGKGIDISNRLRHGEHGKRDRPITNISTETNLSLQAGPVHEKELDISETMGFRRQIEQMANDLRQASERQSTSGNLDKREQAVVARSAAFELRETALAKREEAVNTLEKSVKAVFEGRESAVKAREEKIKKRELEVVLLEETTEREKKKTRLRWDEKQMELYEHQTRFEINEENQKARLSVLQSREHAMETRGSSLMLREATISAREEAVSVREAELGPRGMEVKRREEVIERFGEDIWNLGRD